MVYAITQYLDIALKQDITQKNYTSKRRDHLQLDNSIPSSCSITIIVNIYKPFYDDIYIIVDIYKPFYDMMTMILIQDVTWRTL